MAGLIAPDAGTVRVDGFDPFTDRKAALAALGILFQNPDHQILFPTVEEELGLRAGPAGPDPGRWPQARVAMPPLLAEGRAHWAKAPVTALSQGQRHYLCLLAVLLMGPRTILLDEPLAGLDLPTQARLARRFAALPQRLITITHDPADPGKAPTGCSGWRLAAIAADGPPSEGAPRLHRRNDPDRSARC